MAKEGRAAFDELSDSSLGDITAAQLLEAIGRMDYRLLAVWPEKKKVELEIEPGALGRVALKDLVVRLQSEKKKYELEIEPIVGGSGVVQDFRTEKKKVELETDPLVGGRRPPIGSIDEKKGDLGSGGSVSLDLLIDRLEERFRDRGGD